MVLVTAAALLAGAQQQPAAAQGLPLIRDAEIETLLNDYARPIFKAAGLGEGRVAIRIVRSDIFNAFVLDGRNVFIHTGTLMQALTPDQLRGRVASVSSLFVSFSNELGAFESGAVAGLFGPVFAVVSGGVGTLVVVATVALKWPVLLRMPPLHALRPEGFAPRPVREHAPEPAGARTAEA